MMTQTPANWRKALMGGCSCNRSYYIQHSLNGSGGNDITESGDDAGHIAGDDVAVNGLEAEISGNDLSMNTPYLIADYACQSMAAARYFYLNKSQKIQKQRFQRGLGRSSTETVSARSTRLAGHKGLGGRMDSARVAKNLPILDGWLNDQRGNNSCHS
jgi:hypothetical protein